LIEYAETVRTYGANTAILDLESDAYSLIGLFLNDKKRAGQRRLTKHEFEALQKFKSYRDRYPHVGRKDDQVVESWQRIDTYLECIPRTKEDQARRDFLARYKSGTPQQAPSLAEVTWLGGDGSPPLLNGNIVLIAFWGLRCQHCLQSFPLLQEMHDRYQGRGMEIVAVHAQRTEAAHLTRFCEQNMYTFHIGQGTRRLCSDFQVKGLPSYYLVDRQGRLIWGPERTLPGTTRLEESLNAHPQAPPQSF